MLSYSVPFFKTELHRKLPERRWATLLLEGQSSRTSDIWSYANHEGKVRSENRRKCRILSEFCLLLPALQAFIVQLCKVRWWDSLCSLSEAMIVAGVLILVFKADEDYWPGHLFRSLVIWVIFLAKIASRRMREVYCVISWANGPSRELER